MTSRVDLEVARGEPGRARIIERVLEPLADGEVLLRVERFGCSANNVTYALLGETLRYWDFFPATEDGWGRVPAWGYARVLDSKGVEGPRVGDRLYGYVPMSSHLSLRPGTLRGDYVRDNSSHRVGLPPAYNAYRIAGREPDRHEDATLLLRPLFTLAWLLADELVDTEPKVGQVIITSASSKTALALAYMLRVHGVSTIGVTSSGNAGFVADSGVYDHTILYHEITASDLVGPAAVLVDIAGMPGLRSEIYREMKGPLRKSVLVGMTHGDANGLRPYEEEPSEANSVIFSAPDRMLARSHEWGGRELQRKMDASWTGFLEWASGWVRIRHARGARAALEVWRTVVAGAVPADVGNVLML